MPRRPEPRLGVGGADAVVGDLDHQAAVDRRDAHLDRRGVGVLDDVRDRLGDDVVRGGLDRLGQALVGHGRARPAAASGPRAPSSAARRPRSVSTAGWMPRASSRSSSSAWASSSLAPTSSSPAQRPGRSPTFACASRSAERERDQPLLRAVVEVALEPPPLVVAGRDDPRARGAQLLLLLLAQRDVEAAGDDPHDPARVVEQRARSARRSRAARRARS